MAKIGELIGGKYEILKEIGQGGMSVVYLAMDKNLNKQWAVKEIRHDVYGEERKMVVDSFLREANLMKKLDHPILPRIVDIIDQNYVVMDYIEGDSLDIVLDKYGAQPQEKVIEWGMTLCEVLDYLHTRVPPVIYRDMKPGNIKLRPDGSIRLFDFGIAREWKEERVADTTDLGTKGYAAPEQYGGKGQTDPRTDVYGLGMTLHHLVTGKNPAEPPYELYPIRHFDPTLSSGLEWIIKKSVQLNKEERFQSCAEMLYALQNVDKYSAEYKSKQKKKIHIFAGLLIAAGISLGVGIGGTVAYQGLQNQNYEANMDEDTAEGYEQAIRINPGKADAYLGWMDMYMRSQSSESGVTRLVYSSEEAQKLEAVFDTQNLKKLKESDPEGYAEVCYNAGYLNWYFYGVGEEGTDTGGSNEQVARIVRSVKWFEKVLDLNKEDTKKQYLDEKKRASAECYYNMGDFFQKRESAEIGDTGGQAIYREYFDNVTELIDTLGLDHPVQQGDDKDVNSYIRVQMYNLIIYSIDSNVELFKNQGVTQKEMQNLYNIAADNTKELEPNTENAIKLRDQILDRLDSVQKKIDMAYKEKANE